MAITSIADVILTIVSAKAITTSLVQSVDDPKIVQNLWLAYMARYARLVKIGMSLNTTGKISTNAVAICFGSMPL